MAITFVKQPAALILSKQPVQFTVDADDEGTNLRIKAGLYGSSDADSVAADINGQAIFELSDYLQNLISERYKTGNSPVKYSNLAKQVQFAFTSYTGSPQVQASELISDPFFLLDGYVPKSQRKSLYASYNSLLAYLQDSKRFLNWYPLSEDKPVLPDQPEFLNYIQIANQSPVSIVMHCLIKFSDGSTATMPNVTVTNVAYMQVVYFPTGYKQLGIDTFVAANYPGKTVTDYYIYLSSGAFQVSLMQNYHVDTAYYENVRYLYIRNAFGLLDILRCTGRGEQTNSLKFEMVRTDGRVLPDKLNWRFEKTDTVKVNTGFISAGVMLWLSDLDFTEAYELIGSNLHPIVFKDLELPVVHDQVYQYSAELQYEYAYNEISE